MVYTKGEESTTFDSPIKIKTRVFDFKRAVFLNTKYVVGAGRRHDRPAKPAERGPARK